MFYAAHSPGIPVLLAWGGMAAWAVRLKVL